MKTAIALGLSVVLGACGQMPVRVLDETAQGVVIQGTVGQDRAQEAAEKSCARHGRHARFNQMDTFRDYVFDCVD